MKRQQRFWTVWLTLALPSPGYAQQGHRPWHSVVGSRCCVLESATLGLTHQHADHTKLERNPDSLPASQKYDQEKEL